MKEIIYVQAGSLANYIGTHFWNTQECYFTYGLDKGDETHDQPPLVMNEVSFRESYTNKDEPILHPRLLVFDRKVNFGTLSKRNALFGPGGPEAEDSPELPLWTGDVVEHKQDPIPKSTYHDRIDNSDIDENETSSPSRDDALDVRYWSDYNRLYYTPKTIQKLPGVADWESAEGDWAQGKQLFQRFNDETALMEDALRSFVEECDLLQGIQLSHDISTFGSFIDSFLISFRDEYPKLSVLSIPVLSEALSSPLHLNDILGRRKALNDALCLRSLNELAEMNILIQPPSTWSLNLVPNQRKNLYNTSALLSAHIESATLPLRLREPSQDLEGYTSQLNYSGTTRFANLTGQRIDQDLDDNRRYSFSMLNGLEQDAVAVEFARQDVFRGFTDANMTSYKQWCDRHNPARFVYSSSLPYYPLPTSFPSILHGFRNQKASFFTSVSTTPRMTSLFRASARFVEGNLAFGTAEGLDIDEMKELANDLWVICDGFDDDGKIHV